MEYLGFVILLALAVALLAANIRIVPQAHAYVIERLGAYQATWSVGVHVKVPLIDRVVKKISLKEQVIDFPPQPVITKDNVTMQIDTVIFFQITDPKLYTYGVERPISAIDYLTQTTLKNIYLAEINETKKDSGTIYIDNLRIMYEPKDKDLGLRPETMFEDAMKVPAVTNYTEKLTLSQGKYDHEGADDIIYCEGIISNGTMSGADIAMWNKIKSLMDYEDKVLVLSMNGDIDNINDKREIRVLKEILEKASQNNDVFVVFKGEGENTVIEDKVRYVSYDDSFEIGISGGKISYKN
jgi:hypothetical protein